MTPHEAAGEAERAAQTAQETAQEAERAAGEAGRLAREAGRSAREAAESVAVRVRELRDISEFRAAARLFNEIWQPDPDNPPVTVELMKAFTHAGNYVSGAYDEEDRLVGASVGFLAAPPGQALHSHVTGSAHKGAGF